MKRVFVFLSMIVAISGSAQPYQANWESLDKRPTPQWWKDAKFGIFIHWGVYAVPGWSPKGTYAEWYQQGLQNTDTARQRFHKEKFGSRTYYDLEKDFKAELYKPDEWASLFEKSGAKYIVLTSKHHDGFALWPSKEASKTWGFPWNAVEAGPKRDLLGDLFKAVRKTSVRAGMYYSLYEWFNPLWLNDKPAYVNNHMWPQLKDLISTYQPDVLWTDGEWDAPAETWKSQEFLSWLFNESAVKEKIVVNDRWGAGVRFKHAGFFTPEYQPDLDFEDHDWEESRGMGHSYGYNREEDSWDYNSTQSLLIALIDKVSRGGNFLLDIGPDEHGKIPPIMQDRLLQMGEWMDINGEAIYGTSRWKIPSQWSDGKKGFKMTREHAGQDIMLKLTIDPDPGYAVKEVFYTYNAKTNSLYAIFPKYPDNRKLVLKDMVLPVGTVVNFLSGKEAVTWKQDGNNVTIELPEYNPNKIKAPYAYAVKIAKFGKFAAKPKIESKLAKPSGMQQSVSIITAPGTVVRYTIDGTEPSGQSPLYENPIIIDKSSTVMAKSFMTGFSPSGTTIENVNVYQWKNALKVKSVKPGLSFEAFELKPVSVNDLQGLSPVKTGVATGIDLAELTKRENVGLRFEGYIKIDKDDVYQLYLTSDDGSRLYIDGDVLIDHDGLHGNDEKQAGIALKKGYHSIRVDFMQATGGIDLKVEYSTSTIKKQKLPAGLLFHAP
jgi:alpha-L-fucosidase